MNKLILALIISLVSLRAFSEELLANCAHFQNAPKWLTLNRVNKAADPVENLMEWSIRRVEVVWYEDQAAFEKAHGMGPAAMAVTQRANNKILLGPNVTEQNFVQIFGHELVHVVSAQKYKDAVPAWIEEGMANYISKNGVVDYKALARANIGDVKELSHPMHGNAAAIHSRYQASQALTEMIASKCEFRNLLRLSVGRKMEDYLENICHITDVNSDFKKWVALRARKYP